MAMSQVIGVRLLAGADLHVMSRGYQVLGLQGMILNYIHNRTPSFLEVQIVKTELN